MTEDMSRAIVEAAMGMRIHGSDYKNGIHAQVLWKLVDAAEGGKR
jgi:hypothetical protein